MKKKAKVVVVGGGIIGCSVAYNLAKSGVSDVCLLDMMPTVGGGETRWSVAMLMHQTENEELTLLAKESIKEYLKYKEQSGIGFHQVGSILYTTKAENAYKIRNRVEMQNRLGVESYLLNAREIGEYVPFINVEDVVIGSYCSADGYLDDQQVMVSWYKNEAERLGVEFYTDTQVKDVIFPNNEIRGVVTAEGFIIETEYLVNATGRMGNLVARMADTSIPMTSDRRSVFLIKPDLPINPFPILEHIDRESQWYIRPSGDNILFGVGPTTPVVTDRFEKITSRLPVEEWTKPALYEFIHHRMPSINQGLTVEEKSWSGVRSLIPDDLPILGDVDGVKGFINCCGLSGFGVTTAPIVGRLTAEYIANQKSTTMSITPFRLARFDYKSWQKSGKSLLVGTQSIESVAERFGTPLYLYDSEIALNRLSLIRTAFPDFEILYTFKANPNLELVKVLAAAGTGAEISSLNELDTALQAGYIPAKITMGGPGKQRNEIEEVILKEVGVIDVESERELVLLEEIGRKLEKQISVTLRINTEFSLSAVPGERMAGAASQYGMDESAISDILAKQHLKYVKIEGIHVHIASQVLNLSDMVGHCVYTAKFAKALFDKFGFNLRLINFGGGFGVPYSAQDKALDIFALGGEVRKELAQIFVGDPRQRPRFQFELGRFLVAEAGIFIAKIIEVKKSKGNSFVITNGGINGFSRPAMPWAQQHICSIAGKEGEPTGKYKVVGRSCLPADVLCESAELSDPQEGDILVMHQAGAYGFTMSMLLWAGQIPPKEIVFSNGELVLSNNQNFLAR